MVTGWGEDWSGDCLHLLTSGQHPMINTGGVVWTPTIVGVVSPSKISGLSIYILFYHHDIVSVLLGLDVEPAPLLVHHADQEHSCPPVETEWCRSQRYLPQGGRGDCGGDSTISSISSFSTTNWRQNMPGKIFYILIILQFNILVSTTLLGDTMDWLLVTTVEPAWAESSPASRFLTTMTTMMTTMTTTTLLMTSLLE